MAVRLARVVVDVDEVLRIDVDRARGIADLVERADVGLGAGGEVGANRAVEPLMRVDGARSADHDRRSPVAIGRRDEGRASVLAARDVAGGDAAVAVRRARALREVELCSVDRDLTRRRGDVQGRRGGGHHVGEDHRRCGAVVAPTTTHGVQALVPDHARASDLEREGMIEAIAEALDRTVALLTRGGAAAYPPARAAVGDAVAEVRLARVRSVAVTVGGARRAGGSAVGGDGRVERRGVGDGRGGVGRGVDEDRRRVITDATRSKRETEDGKEQNYRGHEASHRLTMPPRLREAASCVALPARKDSLAA